MIPRHQAQALSQALLAVSRRCEDALLVLKTNESALQASTFARLAAEFLGQSYTNILAPLWLAYPDLEPLQMKEPYRQPSRTLTPASRAAIEAFLAQAQTALLLVQATVPPELAATSFRFGGLAEVESAVEAIQRFLDRAD